VDYTVIKTSNGVKQSLVNPQAWLKPRIIIACNYNQHERKQQVKVSPAFAIYLFQTKSETN
jgi:hypothetical protein